LNDLTDFEILLDTMERSGSYLMHRTALEVRARIEARDKEHAKHEAKVKKDVEYPY
jgi:hypothetical protein